MPLLPELGMMEWKMDQSDLDDVNTVDNAQAFLIARKLIAQHGSDVASFLQQKIDALTTSGDTALLAAWFVIRNAVALALEDFPTLH